MDLQDITYLCFGTICVFIEPMKTSLNGLISV